MNPFRLIIATCLLATTAMVGCANSTSVTPLEAAFDESTSAVEQSVEDASEEAIDRDSYELAIRYNEPHCGAPSFEILVYGRWTRVFLEGRESLLNELEDALVGDSPDIGLRNTVAFGTLVGERETQQGLEFPVFEVERYQPVGGPKDEPPAE